MQNTLSVIVCGMLMCVATPTHETPYAKMYPEARHGYVKRELLPLFTMLGFDGSIGNNKSSTNKSPSPNSTQTRQRSGGTGTFMTSSRPINVSLKSSVQINDNKKENQFQVGLGDGQMGMDQIAESALLRQTQKQSGKGLGRQSSKQKTDTQSADGSPSHVSQKQSQTLFGSLGFQAQSTIECNNKSFITHPKCLQNQLLKPQTNEHTPAQDIFGRFKRFAFP